jgi:hypothetical protein
MYCTSARDPFPNLKIEDFARAVPWLQVISCEHGCVDLDQVFGKEAKGLVAHLNTEGHHRGAVAAARALAADEVHICHSFHPVIPP